MFIIPFSIIVGAFLLSYSLFLPSIALSYRVGAIDLPNARKTHAIPTARAGGFAFFIAFISLLPLLPMDVDMKTPLIWGGTAIFLVGFLDDTISLYPFQKLTGQLAAASIYIALGNENNIIIKALTFLWIIYLCNAINLSDGLNGLAGGITASQSICLGVLAIILQNTGVMWCALLLLGVILGFLPRNFPHAKIFMGDCGALFLGFILAALSSRLVFESGSIICLFSTLLIFRVPTYDTNLSIIRRLIKRKNPFKADKGHFHHHLLRWGFSKECAALALVTASLFFGLVGILIASL